MSLSGTTNTYLPPTLDGLTIIDADAIYINGQPIDTENLVPYTGATKNVNLGTFNFQTLGSISAKEHIFPTFSSTLMTSPTTSSIFYADAWGFSNTISTVSLGPVVSTSYLTLNDITNNSTIVTFQSDGIANFANTKVRISTMASHVYDAVNLSTLQASVAFIENVNALNYVPYTGATDNLNMGGSTITTTGLVNAGALRITSSITNADYTLSVNPYDQLEFTNLSNGSILKTNGSDLFVTGNVNCATLGTNNVEASGSFYLAKGTTAEWRTTLGMSDEYEIKDNAGVMRLRLSKTSGLTVSTMNITQIPSATPTFALGVNGGGQVVSFAVPTATNILPLANTFTNTNDFLSTFTTGVGYTTSINGALTTSLSNFAFTSASFTTAGITGSYTPPLGTITNPSGSTYQIAQTAAGRSIMAISGFTPAVGITYVFQFNIKCTVGTATISVEQDNILVSPALYQLSTGFNRVVGSFTYNGTANTVVFKIYTGVASWNAQWDSFTLSTYSVGLNANMNCQTLNNRITQRYNALTTDVSTLVNRATMDSAIAAAATPNLLPLNNIWTGTNTYNNGVQIAAGSLGVATGNIVKQSATATSFIQITGGNATNSPYMEFYFNGTRRSFIGNANATDMYIASENGAGLSFEVGGARALTIDTSRNITATGRFKKTNDVNPTTTYIEMLEGGASNTPYISWVLNSTRKCYLGFATATNFDFAVENGADLNINTNGANRLKIKADGTTTHTSGDNSYMRYGPNGTWGAYLTVGATPDRSGASNAQVIATNGNLHLDAGNSMDIYYGYYPNSRGAPNVHRWYGTTYVMETIPQNTSQFSHVMCLDGNTLRRSQCVMRQYFKNENIAWTGGFNYTNAFYKYNATCPVRISGRYSYYTTGAGSTYVGLRIYARTTGVYYYYTFHHFQNISYAHTTYPLDMVFYGSDFPTTGWFDTYIYNAGGPIVSDGNDQLQLNCMVLPVDAF